MLGSPDFLRTFEKPPKIVKSISQNKTQLALIFQKYIRDKKCIHKKNIRKCYFQFIKCFQHSKMDFNKKVNIFVIKFL